MDWHDYGFVGYRRSVVALAAVAIIVAGVGVAGAAVKRRLKVGGAVRPPSKLVDVRPVYPEDAKAAHIEGVVILGVVIGEDGSVIDTAVLRSIAELDQAAIDAVSLWKFEPTLLNGEAVEIEMTITINFTLQ